MDDLGIEERIAGLREELSRAKKLSRDTIAGRICDVGFSCLLCGECCQGEDNSVLAFPREIRCICAVTGQEWLEVAGPPEEGEWDRRGCFHTLEWRLKKDGLSCRFYREGRCQIYPARPRLCRTYPFYLDHGKLKHSECRGLGGKIEPGVAEKMAEELIMRQIIEIEEAILLLERYRDFERGDSAAFSTKAEIIVHDSEGEHRIAGGVFRR
jgi:Fe-S-cluster containining protein